MDGDERIGELGLDGKLQSIANLMRGRDAHAAWHDKMEIDEHHASCVPGAEIMRLDSAIGIGRNDLADASQCLGGGPLRP